MKRRQILWIALAAAVVMMLVPPWHLQLANGLDAGLGYWPIYGDSPKLEGIRYEGRIDVVTLLAQYVCVGIALGLAYLLASKDDS